MEIRRPLLQGYGVEYNRIAGPGAIPGFNQGVLIARVNTDIALATFEANVRNLVSDVETAYWELYFAYRNLDAAVQGRDSALQTWQKINAMYVEGASGGEAAAEAQAREQYFLFRSTAEQALSQLYQTESKLRYMMGIAATDGRLIRPADDPTTAKITFDWSQVQSEAMSRSRGNPRSPLAGQAAGTGIDRGQELPAAPRRFGRHVSLAGPGQSSWSIMATATISGGAFDNLASGQFQDWHLGIEGSMPLGFRKQKDGVANAELALARDRAKLRETELEVSHQVAFAIRDMEANLVLTETNFNRRLAAQRNVEAVKATYDDRAKRHRHSQHPLERPAQPGAGRKRLLPLGDQLREVDLAGPLPQGIAAGVQRRLPDRRSLAGEGLLRRPPPCPHPLGRPVPRLRFHLSEGPQPRAVSAVLRPGHGRGRNAGDGPAAAPGERAKQPSGTEPELLPAPQPQPAGHELPLAAGTRPRTTGTRSTRVHAALASRAAARPREAQDLSGWAVCEMVPQRQISSG